MEASTRRRINPNLSEFNNLPPSLKSCPMRFCPIELERNFHKMVNINNHSYTPLDNVLYLEFQIPHSALDFSEINNFGGLFMETQFECLLNVDTYYTYYIYIYAHRGE